MSGKQERKAIPGTDAAEELGLTPGSVRRHYNEGNLDGFLKGTVLWVYLDSLEVFKRTRRRRGRQPGTVIATDVPQNRSYQHTHDRFGTPKTEAQRAAAALKQREYQRDYQRKRRERLRREQQEGRKS